jgi:hypothetical protein
MTKFLLSLLLPFLHLVVRYLERDGYVLCLPFEVYAPLMWYVS